MALAAVLLPGRVPLGWTQLGSRCVCDGARGSRVRVRGQVRLRREPPLAAKRYGCGRRANASSPRTSTISFTPVKDQALTGGSGTYWTGFRRLGTSDGVTPPADWHSATVHAQGSACNASTNPWFDTWMSHEGARSLLEHDTVHSQHPISLLHVHSRDARSSGVEPK